MAPEVVFKRLEPKDIDDVMIVERRSFPPEVQQSKRELLNTIGYPKSIGMLAYVDGKPVAYGVGAPLEVYPCPGIDKHYGQGYTFYLESIAVVPEERGKGIGSALFKKIIELAKEQGYKRLTGHAYRDGWQLARRFGARRLFKSEEFYLDGSDAIYYEIWLT